MNEEPKTLVDVICAMQKRIDSLETRLRYLDSRVDRLDPAHYDNDKKNDIYEIVSTRLASDLKANRK